MHAVPIPPVAATQWLILDRVATAFEEIRERPYFGHPPPPASPCEADSALRPYLSDQAATTVPAHWLRCRRRRCRDSRELSVRRWLLARLTPSNLRAVPLSREFPPGFRGTS